MKYEIPRQMIDFIKLQILNPNIPRISSNPLLEWIEETNTRTGEVKKYTSYFHGMKLEIKNNQHLNISGSIHKFWNSINGRSEQNYNDFRFEDLASVIIQLCDMLDLVPGSCVLQNLEFGVNVVPTIPTNDILRSVINHKGKPFSREYTENKRFRECERQRYIIKIYNKGLQYNQPGNILRFEGKIIKMAHLKGTGVQTLSDLINPAKIVLLGEVLLRNFYDLLFYDNTIQDADLSALERLILTQGQLPTYWVDLKKTNPCNYYKKRDRFKELVKKYGTQDLQDIVGCLVSRKWNDLLKTDPDTLQKLTNLEKPHFTRINHSDKGLKPVMSKDWDQSTEQHPVTSIPCEDKSAEPRRVCVSCGKDITHQKRNSKFCGAKFVGEREAHRCRNFDSNFRNRMKYLIEKERNELTLFDTTPFF